MNLKNKKLNNLIKKYKESFKYIKESKNYIYLIIILFILSSLIGFFMQTPSLLETKILEFIEEILTKTQGMNQLELILFIFLNNLQSTFIGILSGIFFGIIPLISSLSNGYLIGFVGEKTVNLEGIISLWRLLPHGIFELPAIFISLGLGLKIGCFIFNKNKKEYIKENIKKSLKVFFLIIIPLLVIAAIIEGSLIYLLS
ncbi:MAG: stage II sporulation protein M [Nanoarchaeota archaeon]